MVSSFRTRLGTILNYKRDPYVHCQGSRNKANIDSTSYGNTPSSLTTSQLNHPSKAPWWRGFPAKTNCKGTLLKTPNKEPKEYSRKIQEYTCQRPCILLCSYYILGGSCLGFPLEPFEIDLSSANCSIWVVPPNSSCP